MQLIKASIKGYGKFKDFTVDFSKGLNAFCYENGWGKSTLSSFIKVMLYGFDDEGKTSILNERTHYLPWDTNVYGGSLVIEVDGKQYEIRREFGNKKNTGTFNLYDYATGLESFDYTENIGEEILGIDRESFKRTLYIAQSDFDYKLTDSINSKIGNLVDNTDDMNAYETVDTILKDALSKCSYDKPKGALSKICQEMEELKLRLADKNVIENAVNEKLDFIRDVKVIISEKENERSNISKQLQLVGEYKDKAVKQEKYLGIISKYNEKKDLFDESRKYFPVRVPSADEIGENIKLVSELNVLEAKRDNLNAFLKHNELNQVKEEQIRYRELEQIYGDVKYDDSQTAHHMRNWQDYKEVKAAQPLLKADLSRLKMDQKESYKKVANAKKVREIALMIGAILCLLAAGLLYVYNYGLLTSGVCVILGVVLLIFAIVCKSKKIIIEDNLDIEDLENDIENNEAFMENVASDVDEYMSCFGITYNEATVIEDLFAIRNNAGEYERLKKKIGISLSEIEEKENRFKEVFSEIQTIEIKLAKFLDDIGINKDNDWLVQLTLMKDRANNYEGIKKQYEAALVEKEQFEAENLDYEELLNLAKPLSEESVSDLEGKVIAITQELRQLDKELKAYEDELGEYKKQLDQLMLASEKYDNLSEKYEEGKKKYKTVEKVKNYLQMAKVNLTNKYTAPIKSAFDKYYEAITEISSADNEFAIDANMKLTLDDGVKKKTLDYLSKGNSDLVNICMRMAFVDGMFSQDFKNESVQLPFIILDDPFERFDDERIQSAKELIRTLANSRQIIYFTCSEDRKCS